MSSSPRLYVQEPSASTTWSLLHRNSSESKNAFRAQGDPELAQWMILIQQNTVGFTPSNYNSNLRPGGKIPRSQNKTASMTNKTPQEKSWAGKHWAYGDTGQREGAWQAEDHDTDIRCPALISKIRWVWAFWHDMNLRSTAGRAWAEQWGMWPLLSTLLTSKCLFIPADKQPSYQWVRSYSQALFALSPLWLMNPHTGFVTSMRTTFCFYRALDENSIDQASFHFSPSSSVFFVVLPRRCCYDNSA